VVIFYIILFSPKEFFKNCENGSRDKKIDEQGCIIIPADWRKKGNRKRKKEFLF